VPPIREAPQAATAKLEQVAGWVMVEQPEAEPVEPWEQAAGLVPGAEEQLVRLA
jgi:hypothetical protein